MEKSLAGLALLLCACPLAAAPGGRLDVLERGLWTCEWPGDAATMRGLPASEAGFEIAQSSTYRAADGRGTYLRTGDLVILTGGPRKGERFAVRNERMLRRLAPDGREDGLRCVKLGATRR